MVSTDGKGKTASLRYPNLLTSKRVGYLFDELVRYLLPQPVFLSVKSYQNLHNIITYSQCVGSHSTHSGPMPPVASAFYVQVRPHCDARPGLAKPRAGPGGVPSDHLNTNSWRGPGPGGTRHIAKLGPFREILVVRQRR